MALTLLVLASFAYVAGGLFMKLSDGLARGWPTATFVALFVTGSLLQARAMKTTDLGMSYIFVLGLEVLITTIVSAFYLREIYSWSRVAAIVVVAIGVAWLRTT